MPTDPTFAPIYAGGPSETDRVFLENLPASHGFANAAVWAEQQAQAPWEWGSRTLEKHDAFSPWLSQEEAKKRLEQETVTFDIPTTGITEPTFNAMVKREYEKRAYADAVARGPQGIIAGISQFGVGLAAQALDPINLATSFIPFIGPARAARMMAAAGESTLARVGVQAQIGAIQGAAGTAILEPAMHFMAGELQEDYTMADSLLNVAFGTLLGGGLHAGVGAIKEFRRSGGEAALATPVTEIPPRGETPERIHALPVESRMDVARVALAQAIDGRDIDVASTVDYHELRRAAEMQERQPGFLRSAEELFAARQEERLLNKPGFLRDAFDRLKVDEIAQREAGIDARIQERVQGESAEAMERVQATMDRELSQRIRTQDAPTTATQLANAMEAQQVREEVLSSPQLLKQLAAERDVTVKELKERLQRMQDRGARDLAVYKKTGLDAERFQQILGKREPILKALHETAVEGQRKVGAIPQEERVVEREAQQILEDAPADTASPKEIATKDVQEAMKELTSLLKSIGVTQEATSGGPLYSHSTKTIYMSDISDSDFLKQYGATKQDVLLHETGHALLHKWGMTGEIKGPHYADLRAEIRAVTADFKAGAKAGAGDATRKHFNKSQELLSDGLAVWMKNPDKRASMPLFTKLFGSRLGDITRAMGEPVPQHVKTEVSTGTFEAEDRAIAEARDYGKALKAMAACRLRNE